MTVALMGAGIVEEMTVRFAITIKNSRNSPFLRHHSDIFGFFG